MPAHATMSLRKSATFHSPPPSSPSEDLFSLPLLPRRAQTTLEDVVEAQHMRRVALTLEEVDRGLSAVDSPSSSGSRSFRDEGSPVPQGVLNHTVAARRGAVHHAAMTPKCAPIEEPSEFNIGRASLRPRPNRRPSHHHLSDSGLGTSISGTTPSGLDKMHLGGHATSSTESYSTKATGSASAITRSVSSHTSTHEGLRRLSERATTRIYERILSPLLAMSSLKDFHAIVQNCPRGMHRGDIVCLRDLEKTLIFSAPVSHPHAAKVVESAVAHSFVLFLKESTKTAALYLEFCETSIRCIQATVDSLSERERTRPNDRPYTNGYFVDLVDQIHQYAEELAEMRKKQSQGKELDELDASL